jgi:ABC-type branched-subunit amino acid transport system substrate-binding protein
MSVPRAKRPSREVVRPLVVVITAVLIADLVVACGSHGSSPATGDGVSGGSGGSQALPLTGSKPGVHPSESPHRGTPLGGTGTGPSGGAQTGPGSVTTGHPGSPNELGTVAKTSWLPAPEGVHGVTDKTILVGMTSADNSEGASTIGAVTGSDISKYENFTYAKGDAAAVAAVNAYGGIAGRKVAPVIYHYNTANFTSASGRDQEIQRSCNDWTQDHHVFAFNGTVGTEPSMAECAANTKTPWIATTYGLLLAQSRISKMSNYYYTPPSLSSDARERAMAKFLLEHQYFSKGANVAVMVQDQPDTREGVSKGMLPVLAAAGIKPYVIDYPDPISSPWQNYVLQMQVRHITHVIWSSVSSPALSYVLMSRAADSQGFNPKWAIGSDMQPASIIATGAPAGQLANTVGMGWQYEFDTSDTAPHSSTAKICAVYLKKYGQPGGNSWGQSQCEWLFFLQAAFKHATQLSTAGLAQGVARLGTDFVSTMTTVTGATSFAPGRNFGVSTVRMFAYSAKDKNFVYVSRPEPLPQ